MPFLLAISTKDIHQPSCFLQPPTNSRLSHQLAPQFHLCPKSPQHYYRHYWNSWVSVWVWCPTWYFTGHVGNESFDYNTELHNQHITSWTTNHKHTAPKINNTKTLTSKLCKAVWLRHTKVSFRKRPGPERFRKETFVCPGQTSWRGLDVWVFVLFILGAIYLWFVIPELQGFLEQDFPATNSVDNLWISTAAALSWQIIV